VAAGDGLWLIVADVPANEYDETALAKGLQNLDWVGRRAMAHEAVVEHFLSARAVLPMQLFTLFTSDARALQHVEHQRREILAIVKRLERKVEWGLRLTFDDQAVRDSVEAAHARANGGSRSRGPRRGRSSAQGAVAAGAAYLARKRDLLDVHRGQLLAARTAADTLFAALRGEAADAYRRTSTEQAAPGSRLLLDAAFLVPSSRTRAFRAAVNRRAKQIDAAGVVVSLTGPWPPYNFITPPSPSGSARRPGRSARDKGAH
jgi:hypothetical protein